jgi:hypothetical protein
MVGNDLWRAYKREAPVGRDREQLGGTERDTEKTDSDRN